jgi:hypothetical protein
VSICAGRPGVQHHSVADEADFPRVQDARGDEVKNALLSAHHEGVPGVVAALEAHYCCGIRSQHIHDLALAFVAPLGPEDHDI